MMVKPFDPTGYISLRSPSCEEDTWHQPQQRGHDDVVAEQYPPSLNNFDKPKSYMEDVHESVLSEFIEKQTEKIGSPSWAWKAHKKLNHTGEQPLIVQEYLSSNKKEQEDGVLPAKRPQKPKFRSKSAGANTDGKLYQLSITAHQFLTATEMPNESEKIVDHRHGRPTRTSLLRARKRIPSAPGVKATVEVKTDLHLQQNLAAKREEKYKTVDVPEELLPITDTGETVHQFLVGARYNRGHYRDAKCLATLGLYVCRDDISNCFLRPSSSQSHFHPRNLAQDYLMKGPMSVSSSSIRSSFRPKSARPSSRAREAWTVSGQVSAPNTSPTDSRDGFSQSEESQKPIAKNTLIDGSFLRSSWTGKVSDSVEEDSCVLCQSNVPLCKGSIPAWSRTERRNSNPARLWSGKKKFSVKNEITSTKESLKDVDETSKPASAGGMSRKENFEHMNVQQYHLRILGTKVGVKCGIPSAPRSNFLYQNVKKTQPTLRSTSARTKKKVNVNNNADKEKDSLRQDPKGNEIERPSSQISVHISTKSLSEDDGNSLHDRNLTADDGTKIDLECDKKNVNSDHGNHLNDEEGDDEIRGFQESGKQKGTVQADKTVEEQRCEKASVEVEDDSSREGGNSSREGSNSHGDEVGGERGDGCQRDVGIDEVSEENMGHDEVSKDEFSKEKSDFDRSSRDEEIYPCTGENLNREGIDAKDGSDSTILDNKDCETAETDTICEAESKCISNTDDATGQPEEDDSVKDETCSADKTNII